MSEPRITINNKKINEFFFFKYNILHQKILIFSSKNYSLHPGFIEKIF